MISYAGVMATIARSRSLWTRSRRAGRCGGHVFGEDPEGELPIALRLGTVEGDPKVEPSWRAGVSSAPDWYPIPDDGLTRYPERRPKSS